MNPATLSGDRWQQLRQPRHSTSACRTALRSAAELWKLTGRPATCNLTKQSDLESLANMDLAFDHIQEDAATKKEGESGTNADIKDGSKDAPKDESKPEQPQSSLNSELKDAYEAFSASPWGTRLGGLWGNVIKQVNLHTSLSDATSEVSNCHRANPCTPRPPKSWLKLPRSLPK